MSELTAANRRAHRCPDCGQVFGALQDDLSMICAQVAGLPGDRPKPGCGLRMHLCPAHGLRTRREGDPPNLCRCAEAAQPIRLAA